MIQGFTQIDKHFEQMQSEFNQRFSEIVHRLDRFMFCSLGIPPISINNYCHGRHSRSL